MASIWKAAVFCTIEIIKRLLKQSGGSPSSMRQQAYILGGGTASGKSTILNRDIAKQLFIQVVEQKRHLVLESTLASTKRSKKLIEWLKDAGYRVHLYIADIPVEQAIQRSDNRGKRAGVQRKLDLRAACDNFMIMVIMAGRYGFIYEVIMMR